jgi:hypothetical protein
MRIKTNMVYWWSDIDKRRPKYSEKNLNQCEKNLNQCYCVDHVSHMDCPGIESGSVW